MEEQHVSWNDIITLHTYDVTDLKVRPRNQMIFVVGTVTFYKQKFTSILSIQLILCRLQGIRNLLYDNFMNDLSIKVNEIIKSR